ncbi:DUF6733 family protein [uncultured Psychroserpens sp.]|uniref:DUF6733 family protein n=1 Tax=uncultured Psychroserpens sp. TaxID=255436 RepID=UPI002615D0C3|nr:DUF6733 family protein [uncultured Psychroserpens sp.]
MKKLFTISMFLITYSLIAQDDAATDDKIDFGLNLNHDAFFGFNPMMTFGYTINENSAITAYGIQWGAGTGSAWGQWTEFGLGYNKTLGYFDINPQIGFTMGNLLSSGASQKGIVGDGIVPNLTVNYDSNKLEGQIYFGYYAALTDKTEVGDATNNYIHYWANFGFKVASFLSLGAHFEELYLSGGDINGGGELDRTDGYKWLGPYLELKKGSSGLRVSLGANLADEDDRFAQNDFYKLTFFTSL